MQVDLREYQESGSDFLVVTKRALLADEMGLGKTLETLYALYRTRGLKTNTLIATKSSALGVWLREIRLWWPELEQHLVIIQDNAAKRKKLWDSVTPNSGKVVLTVIEIICQDRKPGKEICPQHWHHIIVDEAHKLRNRTTQVFKAFKSLRSEYMWLITGTPASKSPADLFGLLHLLDPKTFTSYWRFVGNFCVISQTPWGRQISGPRNIPALKELLSKYMIRRLKKDVLPQLPPKIRTFLDVEMTDKQRKMYDELLVDAIAELPGGELLLSQSVLATIIRLRQLLVTPKLLHPDLEWGAGLDAIIDKLFDEMDEPHALIFTPFAKAIPIFQERLKVEKYAGPTHWFKSGMYPEELVEVEENFRKRKGIAFSTVSFGQSWSAEHCPNAFFLGAEWDPQMNTQAEDRLHRGTTLASPNIFYLRHLGTVEGDVFEKLDEKYRNTAHIRQATIPLM